MESFCYPDPEIIQAQYPDDLLNRLEHSHQRFIELAQENVRFGPIYSIETSQGQKLTVVPISPPYHDPSRPYVDEIWTLFAFNENDEIVGLRESEVLSWDNPIPQATGRECNGNITIGPRGYGIATALELCFFDFVQKLTAHHLSNIYYFDSENMNRKALKILELQLEDDPENTELMDAVEKKRAENQRWIRLYGDNQESTGLFDFRNDIKFFRMRPQYFRNIEHWGFTSLEREEYKNDTGTHIKGTPTLEIVDHPDHHGAIHAERTSYFRIIKEQLQKICQPFHDFA